MQLYRIEARKRSPFITAYQAGEQAVSRLYDWSHLDSEKYEQRLHRIKAGGTDVGLSADRQGVAALLSEYHLRLANVYGETSVVAAVADNIAEYAAGAVTIVTGQQAGIGTGPLYTINKIISLLKAVEHLRMKLQEPLIPIFWVAGEDHDIDEVDHIYVNTRHNLQKVAVDWHGKKPRTSVANVSLSHRQVGDLLEEVKGTLKDSPYKAAIVDSLEIAYRDHSLSTAFAALLYRMFAPYGLVLFDAHDGMGRQLEKPMLMKMVNLAADIQQAYRIGYQAFADAGYTPLIDADDDKTGLYMNLYEKRYSVHFDNQGFYVEGLAERFSKDQLIGHIAEGPHLFSTNVFLRTVMQEYLFQPLMYIGGAAEVQYWGQVKPLFHLFGYTMPIVTLRNSYTYITPDLQAKLAKYTIDCLPIIAQERFEYEEIVSRFVQGQYDLATLVNSLQNQWQGIYSEHLQGIPESYVSASLVKETEAKTWERITLQLKKMQQLLENAHNERYKELKADIRWIGNELLPHGILQERVLNVYQLVNAVGMTFLANVLQDCHDDDPINGNHYIVYMENSKIV